MKQMYKITESELQNFTKQQLIEIAKSRCDITLATSHKKDEMISTILKAVKKNNEELSAAGETKKKSTAKPQRKLKISESITRRIKTVAAKSQAKLEVLMAAKLQPKTVTKAKPIASVKAKITKKEKTVQKTSVTRIHGKKSPFERTVSASSPSRKPGLKASANKSPENVTAAPGYVEKKGSEEAVQDSKYFLAPEREKIQLAYEPPERYEDDRIVAFIRDPFWLFSFWDIHPETERRIATRHGLNGNCKATLRVYDVTGIDFNGQNASTYFDIEVNTIAGDWYVNVPEDNKAYCLEIGLKDSAGNFYMMSRSNVIMLPRSGVSDRLDEEWMIADEDFWHMYAISGGFADLVGSSEEISGAMEERLKGGISSGAVSSFGASEMMARRKPDDFWFRLDCELIVFGATCPDAEVTLAGKPIKLRPDGTFTARFALPNGLQTLPATALSADRKYEKTITPTVSRNTVSLNVKTPEEEEQE